MVFICLPILFGCQTHMRQEGDPAARICPRCNNAGVIQTRKRTWVTLCFVPIVPLKAGHHWLCGVCRWEVPLQPGWEPMSVDSGHVQSGGGAHFQPGYQPSYQPPPAIAPGKSLRNS
ncbi:hypothetical protein PENSPDRAFT_35820 [Peniophora sp. CONT]|nr:hypothetical protein PENSPDRAFT_35820 [Peniophora sp. CONT]